jgi:hypothetical protein
VKTSFVETTKKRANGWLFTLETGTIHLLPKFCERQKMLAIGNQKNYTLAVVALPLFVKAAARTDHYGGNDCD